VTYIFTNSEADPRVREWIPMATFEGTALQMKMEATPMAFRASNLTMERIEPLAVKVGTCYDNLEWWRAQTVPVQLANARTPDGLQVRYRGGGWKGKAEENIGRGAQYNWRPRT
jgi:hypothetical protein